MNFLLFIEELLNLNHLLSGKGERGCSMHGVPGEVCYERRGDFLQKSVGRDTVHLEYLSLDEEDLSPTEHMHADNSRSAD